MGSDTASNTQAAQSPKRCAPYLNRNLMLIRILTLLFLLFSSNCFGQEYKDSLNLKQKLILSEEQNTKWFDSLKKLSTPQQMNFILDRVILDTNVYIKYSYADRIHVDYSIQSKTKFEGCCKPVIAIETIPIVFYFDDKFDQEKILDGIGKFKQMINDVIIDEIQVMPKERAMAFYGSDAMHGAILLKITDKKSIKLIKKLYGLTK